MTKAGMLYLTTWLSILKNVQELPVAFVHFDDLFKNAHKSLSNVADTLGIPLPPDFDERVQQFGSQFLDTTLRHQNYQEEDLSLASDLPPLAIQLYRYLSAACTTQQIKKATKFILYSETAIRELRPLLAEYDHLYRGQHQKSSEIDRLTEENLAQAGLIVQLEQIAADRGSEIERLSGDIIRVQEVSEIRHVHIEHLKKERTEHAAEVERLNGEIVRLNEEAGAKESHVSHLEQVAGDRGAEIEKLNGRVKQLQEDCAKKRSQIANLEQDNWVKDSQKDEIEKQFLEEIKNAFQESEKILEICKIKEATTNPFYLEIGSSIIGDENVNLTHSHLNFTFKNIKLFGRHWKLLQVRLVEHNGKAGLVIFNDVENSSYPLYHWEKDGEENGVDFMIFVPADTKSRIKLVKAPTSDLLLIREITARIIGYIYVHGDNNLNRWIHVGRKLVQQIDEIDERIHYDDVVVNTIENRNEITINFKIANLYYGGICISSYNISWSVGPKESYLILKKPEKEELNNHIFSDLGEISNMNIEISFKSKKEVEKTIYQWEKMTRKERIFLKLVASEISNLLVHLFCKETISSKNKIIKQERTINKKISRLKLER
jgi:hypothetical protein